VAELTPCGFENEYNGVKAVFLTGGTGFLGTQVARRLISNTDLTLVALVRARTKEEAACKLRREWWECPELRSLPPGRVGLVAGDVSEPQLGLTSDEYTTLTTTVTHVIHAAADLRLDGPLTEMRRVNVAGTANVLEFASAANADHGLRRFSHVSTAYVAGGRGGPVQESELSEDYGFHNTYELTKFEGESLVRNASDRLPVSIFRPGMIVGDSGTGEVKTFNTIYYPLRLYFERRIRVVPASGSSRINIVPVDYVADSIVRLTMMEEAKGRTFHLTSPFASLPTLGDLVGTVRQWAKEKMNLELPKVLFAPVGRSRTWTARRLEAGEGPNAGLAQKLGELEAYCSNGVFFQRDNTDRLLGSYEPDWRQYLPNLLNYAVRHSFLHPRPRTVHEAILHRLEGRVMPVTIADVIDGRVVRRDTSMVRDEMLSASRALRAMGVSKGDRVGIVGLNSSRYLILDVAIGMAGAVSVPIYYTSPPREVVDILSESGAKVVFVDSAQIIRSLREAGLEIPIVSFCREEAPEATPEQETWEEFLRRGISEDAGHEASPVCFEDLATVRYTSGTTGRPKGVCFDHQNLRWLGETVCSLFPWNVRSKEITYLSFLPLNHCVEGIICAYAPYYAPAAVNIYFLEDFKQLGRALPLVKPTVFFSVPRFYEKAWEGLMLSRLGRTWTRSPGAVKSVLRPFMRRALLSKAGLDKCEQMMVGSAPVNKSLLEEFRGLGIEIHDAYGLTEAPLVTMNLPGRNKLGTVGEPLPETKVRIGEDGEILVKGPQVTKAYAKGELQFEDGYLATGDLGRIEGGYLTVDGRKKELIKTSYGKYVQPAKVEAMLKGIKDVEEAMVIGEGRPFCTALIWIKKGVDMAAASATVDKAVPEVNSRLSHPEQVRRWVVLENNLTIDGGELTPNLKLKRRVVATRFRDVIEGLYAGHQATPIPSNPLEVSAVA